MSRLLLILSLTTLAAFAKHPDHDRYYEEEHCGQCDTSALKRGCDRDYHHDRYQQHQDLCYKPKITFYQKETHGCQIAVVKCKRGRYSNGKVSLFSSASHHDHGDLLFQGYGEEKIIRCNEKGKWVAKDIYGDYQRVKKVYCVDDEIQAPQQPNYDPIGNNGY